MTVNPGAICYPEMNSLVGAIEKRENIMEEHKNMRE